MATIPQNKLKAEQVRRTYSLVVDDLGLSFGSIYQVKQSLKKFVSEQMEEGDLVAIVRTGSGVGALQSFTSDKRQLLAAINKIKWNSHGRVGISSFEPIISTLKEDIDGMRKPGENPRISQGNDQDRESERNLSEIRNDNFSVGTLGALSYIIRGMRELPGRKSVMLFSEGFSLTTSLTPFGALEAIRILDDTANRSPAVIYTLESRGLSMPGMFQAISQTPQQKLNAALISPFGADEMILIFNKNFKIEHRPIQL